MDKHPYRITKISQAFLQHVCAVGKDKLTCEVIKTITIKIKK